MPSVDHVNELLTVAARLIDTASGGIRDTQFEPVRENIEHMGHALASIFEVQQKIHAQRPDLMPEYLKEPSLHPEGDIALTKVMYRATNLEKSGDFEAAIAEYERLLIQGLPELHRGIASVEIKRLRGNGRP